MGERRGSADSAVVVTDVVQRAVHAAEMAVEAGRERDPTLVVTSVAVLRAFEDLVRGSSIDPKTQTDAYSAILTMATDVDQNWRAKVAHFQDRLSGLPSPAPRCARAPPRALGGSPAARSTVEATALSAPLAASPTQSLPLECSTQPSTAATPSEGGEIGRAHV